MAPTVWWWGVVLLPHRHLDRVDAVAGVTAALSVGSVNPDAVALETLKAADDKQLNKLTNRGPIHPGAHPIMTVSGPSVRPKPG